ncbi:MAG: TerB family tellurite resistance protein [Halobacteriovoraceae bacterium]|nr:TerB family tellurite resistance protein [Halobacteriovoraceae bacterium]
MGLKSTFEEYSKLNKNQIVSKLKDSKTYLWATSLNLQENETLVLSSLSIVFLKMIAIDRDIDEKEIQEVKKRLNRFIKIEEPALSALMNSSKNDIEQRTLGAKLLAASSFYLATKANDKTKTRIFRYLVNIISSDKKIENEEEYLLKLIGMTFGINEKTVKEYLLAAELQTSLEQMEKLDPSLDPFSSNNSDSPIIKFDLN